MSYKLLIPLAIIISGALVGISVYFSGNNTNQTADITAAVTDVELLRNALTINNDSEPAKRDHIIGSPNARIIFIEYSDPQCPYCAQFHKTMERVMSEYAPTEQVAWVYRHYWPRQNQYHPLAGTAANASECVAELAGNEAFFTYLSNLFEGQPQSLQPRNLQQLGRQVGADNDELQDCINEGRYDDKIDTQYRNAGLIGVTGTPYTIVSVDGQLMPPIQGAQSYESIKQFLDQALLDLSKN